MVPPVPAGVEIPPEPPDVGARALSVAARLLRRRLDVLLPGLPVRLLLPALAQRRPHVATGARRTPDQALRRGVHRLRRASARRSRSSPGASMKRGSRGWTGAAIGGVVLGLAAVALQCIEYTTQNFGPTDGAYASVFCAWTAFYLIAVLARCTGSRRRSPPSCARAAHRRRSEGDIKDPDRLIAPGLDAAVFYWAFLAGIGVITYVMLYLL